MKPRFGPTALPQRRQKEPTAAHQGSTVGPNLGLKRGLTVLILLLLIGCNPSDLEPHGRWQQIAGRDAGEGSIMRHPVYRARVPDNWERQDPPAELSNADTTLPIVTYVVEDMVVVIHNFPYDRMDQRIPPGAQTARWRRQLVDIRSETVTSTPCNHGGFWGVCFDGEGELKGVNSRVVGWAMQLDAEHYRNLSLPGTTEEQKFLRQMRADYTIKAYGPPTTVARHRDELEAFAHSFELVEEIPARR